MKELEVKRVPFMGTDLMAAKDESGTIWAGVRWMCDGMGLSKGQRDRQITNINADSVISKGAANLRLPTAGGKQSVLCLKLDFVPLWLAKINITPAMQAETPELAERLEAYQLKAKGVMASKYAADGDGNTAVEWLLAISASVLTIGVMALTITDFIENMAELQKMATELGLF